MLGIVSVMGAIIWVGCVRFFYCDDRKGYRPHGHGSGVPLQLIPTSCWRSCAQAAVDASRVASQFFAIFLGRGLLVFRSALQGSPSARRAFPVAFKETQPANFVEWSTQALRKHATSTLLLGDMSLLLFSFYSDTNKGKAKYEVVFSEERILAWCC